jgi:GDP-L-fucose synthase
MRVLVTGGTGLVGTALKKLRPDWIYVNSKTYGSLTSLENVRRMFDEVKPDVVIHLAANVGGLFKNMNKRLEMFEDNVSINTNVLSEASRHGVKRVINMLSTCVFPDGLEGLLTPAALHMGPPHPSNEGYAYAKRISEVHSRIIRETTETWVTCLVPTNIYGPNDNFSLEDGHVVPSLIHRASIAKKEGTKLQIKGTGVALRQFIFSDDLARIVVWAAMTLSPRPPPIVVCCPEIEYSIRDISEIIAKIYGIELEFVGGPDGQMRKKAVPGPGDFPAPCISLEDGLHETISWFNKEFKSYTINGSNCHNNDGYSN